MPFRVLAVCLGNICRSPAAEAVIRAKSAAAGLDVVVDSAGTGSAHVGEAPHPHSVREGRRRGYDVVGRARRLAAEDFTTYDLIVTMDPATLRDTLRMAPAETSAEVVPLRRFAPQPGDETVPDPWGREQSAYETMYDLIEEAADGLVDSLR